jgi:hypothetical protein
MLEKDITRHITDWLKKRSHCWFFKVHGGLFQMAGIPDIIGCYSGRFFALEVKTATGKTTRLQELCLSKIRDAGGLVGVVRSVAEAEEVLKHVR